MSKISKSIVISEFLWLLFFAVVFLKFDYTRTTLAVVNAIVWLCIVLVFSIIILSWLQIALDFYSKLNNCSDDYLAMHDFSREEIDQGLRYICTLFGYDFFVSN